jgi:hypothetical protein
MIWCSTCRAPRHVQAGQLGPGPANAVEAEAPLQQGNCSGVANRSEGGVGGDGGGCGRQRRSLI